MEAKGNGKPILMDLNQIEELFNRTVSKIEVVIPTQSVDLLTNNSPIETLQTNQPEQIITKIEEPIVQPIPEPINNIFTQPEPISVAPEVVPQSVAPVVPEQPKTMPEESIFNNPTPMNEPQPQPNLDQNPVEQKVEEPIVQPNLQELNIGSSTLMANEGPYESNKEDIELDKIYEQAKNLVASIESYREQKKNGNVAAQLNGISNNSLNSLNNVPVSEVGDNISFKKPVAPIEPTQEQKKTEVNIFDTQYQKVA